MNICKITSYRYLLKMNYKVHSKMGVAQFAPVFSFWTLYVGFLSSHVDETMGYTIEVFNAEQNLLIFNLACYLQQQWNKSFQKQDSIVYLVRSIYINSFCSSNFSVRISGRDKACCNEGDVRESLWCQWPCFSLPADLPLHSTPALINTVEIQSTCYIVHTWGQ